MTATPLLGHTVPISADRAPQLSRVALFRIGISTRLIRTRHWEFWPTWVIYLPLWPYIFWLAFRHRSISTCTACNPKIPLGGMVGESKWQILRNLPSSFIIPTALIEPSLIEQRVAMLETIMRERGWSFPIILKPDVGERGAGVRLIDSLCRAREYLTTEQDVVLAQVYHPGPYEAGIFYLRSPDHPKGRIFSITDKRFAAISGDGRSSIRTLIHLHPRYSTQANVFLRRLGPRADRVPEHGEVVPLGIAGNHCQGAMFLDGEHLITQQLELAIDRIAQSGDEFYFGRFDVRYTDPEEFRNGRGFQIIELNGLLSESTNIYDPAMPFWRAQRILRDQWRWAYLIGAANRARGVPVPSWRQVRELIFRADDRSAEQLDSD